MATLSRPQRKKEQPDLFTPISWQEEMTLWQVLQTSLRPIPLNGSVSEDEVTSDDEVLDEEDIVSDFIDEKNTGDEYGVSNVHK